MPSDGLSWRSVQTLSARLTERDRRLLRLLAGLRVLTTSQVARVEFGSVITARHRLGVLAGLGVVARFRPRAERGSSPGHYVLAPLGAAVVAAEAGAETAEVEKTMRRARRDHALVLGASSKLRHLLGVNDFYSALCARARSSGGGCELTRWVGERNLSLDGEARPDALGSWREAGLEVSFLLEYDTGTERLHRLVDKLPGYRDLLRSAGSGGGYWWLPQGPVPWVLFCFTSDRREANARAVLRSEAEESGLWVATGTVREGEDPGEAWWHPVYPFGRPRVRLAGLGPAGPYEAAAATSGAGGWRRPWPPNPVGQPVAIDDDLDGWV